MSFLSRALVPPIVLGGAALIATAAFPQTTPTATASSDPTVVAVAQVTEQTADLTRGATCWEDPTGHTPTHAVVKDVDGVTAYRVTAQDAWDAANDGDVWVIKWCEKEKS